jgi:hypothetical protein
MTKLLQLFEYHCSVNQDQCFGIFPIYVHDNLSFICQVEFMLCEHASECKCN